MARGRALSAVEAVVAALRGRAPRCGDVLVVAVDGPSGAGKTTFGAALAQTLACPLLSVDLLYPGWDGLAEGVRLLDACVLAPLAAGEVAHVRTWDWSLGAWGTEVAVSPVPVLVVEGCGSSTGPAGERASLRVWMDAPEAVRRARAMARDGASYAPHWERWAAQERIQFAGEQARARADVVVVAGEPSPQDGQDVLAGLTVA